MLDRKQMEAFASAVFDSSSQSVAAQDPTLFGVVRVSMNVDHDFNFVAHHLDLKIMDEDLSKNGFSKLSVGLCRRDAVFYGIVKFIVYDEERKKLLQKKRVEILIDAIRFG
jgi:hypothetical protein